MKNLWLTVFLILFLTPAFSQSNNTQPKFDDIRDRFYKNYERMEEKKPFFKKKGKEEEEDDGPLTKFKRWEWLMQTRLMPDGTLPEPGMAAKERFNYLAAHPQVGIRTASWTQVGTSSGTIAGAGRVNVIRIDPTNNSVIYIGTAGGGVWKTTNGGTSWTPLTDGLPNLSIADIAIDSANTNNIYVATGDGYGYTLGQNLDFWGGLYSAGVFKSTDGGLSWNITGFSYDQSQNIVVNRLIIDPSNSNNILVATKNGLMRSIDAGATWTQVLSSRIYDIEFNTASSSIVYCAGNGNIYKSTDGGATWLVIKSGIGSDRISIEVSAANSQVLYSLAIGGSLLKSSDGGATWATMTFPTGASFYGYYDGVLACSDVNSDFIIASGSAMVKSTDGGTTWSSVGGTHSDHHALVFVAGSTSTFYDGDDGGIYKTTNSGSAWTNLSSGLMIAQIYRVATSPTNPNIVYSGWQDNGTRKWNGDNSSWSSVLGGDGMDCMVDYTNPQIAYATTQYGALNRTTNGSTFSAISLPTTGNWVTPIRMDPTTPTTIYAGTASIYKSTNSGLSNSWVNIGDALFSTSSNNGAEDIAIAPSNVNVIYVCSFTKLVKTVDGGASWSTITGTLPITNTGINQIAISNTDPNKVWICLGGYSSGNKVFKSTDGGTTWINVSATLPNIPVNTIVYENNSPDRLYVGTDIGVYYIDNNTSDWSLYSDGLPNVMVHELEINYASSKLVAATYGRGIWQSDLVGVVITNQSVISVSGNMNFGDVPVGSSSQQTLIIGNTGNLPLNVNSINYPNGFNGNWNSGTINAGGSQNVTITFTPVLVQGHSGIITVNSDATIGTNTISCSGNGISNMSINTSTIAQNPLCPNSAVNVSYISTNTFDASNVFTAQLSNANGSFSSPQNIGTLSSTTSGSIPCTIPATATGTGYRIRVVSSGPAVTGTDNGSNLTLTCALPVNTSTSSITAKSATLSWTGSACATSYEVDYKKNGNGNSTVITGITTTSYTLTGLNANTNYQWEVQARCIANPTITSGFTSYLTFKTASKKEDIDNLPEIKIYPNPSNGIFDVVSSDVIESIGVYNLLGQRVWIQDGLEMTTPVQINLNVPGGIYLVEVLTKNQVITRQITVE